jgi:vancomycin resistance protein YoaR
MKLTRRLLLVALLVAVIGAVVGLLIAISIFGSGDRICGGVIVSGVPIGGLSRRAAEDRLRAWANARLGREVTFIALDSRWSGKLIDLGARVKWREALEKAYSVGRTGSFVNRARCVLTAGGSGKRFKADIILDRDSIRRVVGKIGRAVNRPHRDASLRVVAGRLEVVQDSCGIALDQDASIRKIARMAATGRSLISLPVHADRPKITADELAKIDTQLASFTTHFHPSQRDRTHNLVLAARALNGLAIMPGEEFSYNKVIGPRLASRGFRDAPIFVKGKLEPGLGGGVCQVSSTLYNAVLLAGLEIVERSRHARTVPYVAPGRDATVVYGLKDFRFRNNNPRPIGLVATINGGALTVSVYGAGEDKRNVQVFTGKRRYIAAGATQTVVDPSLKPGQTKVIDKGASGCVVTSYRRFIFPDGSTRTEVLANDRYPPQKRIVAVGSAPKAAPAATLTPASSETVVTRDQLAPPGD